MLKYTSYLFADYRIVFQQHIQYIVETNGRLVQIVQVIRGLQERRDGQEKIDNGLALARIPFGRALQIVEQGTQCFCGRYVDSIVSQRFFTKLKMSYTYMYTQYVSYTQNIMFIHILDRIV